MLPIAWHVHFGSPCKLLANGLAVETKRFPKKQKLIPEKSESVNYDCLFLFFFAAILHYTLSQEKTSCDNFCVFLWYNLASARFCGRIFQSLSIFRVPLFSERAAQWCKSRFSLQTIISAIMTLDGHVTPWLPGQIKFCFNVYVWSMWLMTTSDTTTNKNQLCFGGYCILLDLAKQTRATAVFFKV